MLSLGFQLRDPEATSFGIVTSFQEHTVFPQLGYRSMMQGARVGALCVSEQGRSIIAMTMRFAFDDPDLQTLVREARAAFESIAVR